MTLPLEADGVDTAMHRFALSACGYTVVRQAFSTDEILALSAGVDSALAAARAWLDGGNELAYTFYDHRVYLGTRCVYSWGDACLKLLEHPLVERVSDAVIGPHKLFDMSAHSALPLAPSNHGRIEGWHRDIDVFEDSPGGIRYLWFFIYLDDFTSSNGATWIVPGSHRILNDAIPRQSLARLPTTVQLLGRAGDVVMINPSALHSVGRNVTDRPRRMINLSVCHVDVHPLLDHWVIAGPDVQLNASPRMRQMLSATQPGGDATWSVLPAGWRTAEQRTDQRIDPALRHLPREQQGYDRSHRRGRERDA